MKRGISPLISAVLLIAFTITLFLVISSWIRSSIVDESLSKTEEKLSGQLDCLSVGVEISNVAVKSDGSEVKLNADNSGDGSINGLTIRVSNGADLRVVEYTAPSAVPPLGRILDTLKPQALSPVITGANKVEVYPKLESGLCKDNFDSTSNIGSY